MSVREWLNNNAAVVTLVTVVILVVALGVLVMRGDGGGGLGGDALYFYDTGTGELFTVSAAQAPPIDAPSGPGAGVRAYVFSCTSCDDEAGRYIGYLEKFTPEARAAIEAGEMAESFDVIERGRLVSRPDPIQWVSADSRQGVTIVDTAALQCGPGQQARYCSP